MIHDIVLPRLYPKEMQGIKFDTDTSGTIYISDWDNCVASIDNMDQMVVGDTLVNIHFPIFDNFYVKVFHSKNGFTLRKILLLVRKISIDAANYDIMNNPQNWVDGVTPENAWVNNAIVSDIGLQQYGNNIYVSLEN